MPSSNRSSSVPLSFDRFRVTSIQFRVPFRDRQREKRIKQSPDRSWTRKTQVHPHDINTSESKRIDHDVVHLFHANKQSNSMTSSSSLSENPQNKICSNKFFNTRLKSNVDGVFNGRNSSLINQSYSTQLKPPEDINPPTPYMLHYRHSSVPTRIMKRPKYFDESNKQSDLHHIDQPNA